MTDKAKAKFVPPIFLSILVCERVIYDSDPNSYSIVSIVNSIGADSFPAKCSGITLFIELTNGHGPVKIKVKVVDVKDTPDEDEVIYETTDDEEWKVGFVDERQIVSLVMKLNGLVFSHEGEYRFQVWACEHLLGNECIMLGERYVVVKHGGLEEKPS